MLQVWNILEIREYYCSHYLGAYTPTCSTYQLPDFEKLTPEFKKIGIDDIYCMSVNDSFVMNAWAKSQNLQNVKVMLMVVVNLQDKWVC